MNIEHFLSTTISQVVNELFELSSNPNDIILQKTKKEFEGDFTLVTFAFTKDTKKSPDALGHEIGAYLLANSKAVVAECDARTELADDLRPGLCLAPYDELEEAVVRLVHDDAERQRLAQRGFDGIRARRADALVAAPLADALARNRPAHAG